MVKEVKEKVRALRRKGYTYREIRKEFKYKVPKSAVSTWCQGVKFLQSGKKRHKKRLEKINKKARKAAVAANKKKREKFLEELEKIMYI